MSIRQGNNLIAGTPDTSNKVNTDFSNINTISGADAVVEWKAPSSSDPTWYRKYASGWIEQGSKALITGGTSQVQTQVNLVKEMADAYYAVFTQSLNSSNTCWDRVISQTTTSFNVLIDYSNASYVPNHYVYWEVKGIGA